MANFINLAVIVSMMLQGVVQISSNTSVFKGYKNQPSIETDIPEFAATPTSIPTENNNPTETREPPVRVGKNGGVVSGFGGNVKVQFPTETLSEEFDVEIGSPKDPTKIKTTLSGQVFEILATGTESRESVKSFNKAFTIEVKYDTQDLVGDETTLTLFYYDEDLNTWRPLPSKVDLTTKTLTATSDHLTVFDYGTQKWQAAQLGMIESFQSAQFTGAGTYSYLLEVPPGPGGLQPSLTLSYNSQVVDDATNRSQASTVGMGWNLITGYIERMMNNTENDIRDDTFYLVLDTGSFLLLPIAGDPDGDPNTVDYHTSDETFLRIRRYKSTSRSGYLFDTSIWVVWDQTGNKFTFGNNAYYFDCGADDIDIPRMQVFKWSLVSVQNAIGQVLTYEYEKFYLPKTICGGYAAFNDLAVHPKTIIYPSGRVRIRFVNAVGRPDLDPAWEDYGYRIFYTNYFLSEVVMETDSTGTGNWQTIRKYKFTYDTNGLIFENMTWPSGGKTLVLTQIQEFGVGGINSLPATTFFYGDKIHLTSISNGYGGKVELQYESVPWAEVNGYKEYSRNYCCSLIDQSNSLVDTLPTDPVFKPGMMYLIRAEIISRYGGTWAQFGFRWGTNAQYFYDEEFPITTQYIFYTKLVQLPEYTANPRILINCNGCQVREYHFTPILNRYRVIAKRVFPDSTDLGTHYDYTYSYPDTSDLLDGPATNDTNHSAGANEPPGTRYIHPYTEFRGHSQIIETAPDGSKTISWFYQDDIYKGRPKRTIITNSVGNIYSETKYEYSYSTPYTTSTDSSFPHNVLNQAFTDLHIYWSYPTAEKLKYFSGAFSDPGDADRTDISWAGVRREFNYDPAYQGGMQYGNVTQTVESSWNGTAWQDYRVLWNQFFPQVNNNLYLVGLPAYDNLMTCPTNSFNGDCFNMGAAYPSNSYLISSTVYFYDNERWVQNPNFRNPPTVGLLAGKKSLIKFTDGVNFTNPVYTDIKFGYDSWGNIISTTSYTNEASLGAWATAVEQTTTTTYDSTYHTYPVSVINALNQSTIYSYNLNVGLLEAITDANNATTIARYDDFGRMVKVVAPGDTELSPTLSISYYDTRVPFQVDLDQKLSAAGTTMRTSQFYNGLGKMIQTQTAGTVVNGMQKNVVVDSKYDSQGRVITETKPYIVAYNAAPSFQQQTFTQPGTQTTYDLQGRVLSVNEPNGTGISRTYDVLKVNETDPAGHVTKTTYDVWGRVIAVDAPTGPDLAYQYDIRGLLIWVRPGTGTATTLTYDKAGRKLSLTDPDMGPWTYSYDALGNLIGQTDARGCSTTLAYDSLNRLTGKTFSSPPGTCGYT
ncbi:MAG: hypothetical protein C0401_10275, partial [Anaerolinea sp.]|nr:hypothetical protein [Anaerolinea sp.]